MKESSNKRKPIKQITRNPIKSIIMIINCNNHGIGLYSEVAFIKVDDERLLAMSDVLVELASLQPNQGKAPEARKQSQVATYSLQVAK